MKYTLIKSKRKTVALQIRGGELVVRAPMRMSKREIESFINSHEDWIKKHLSAALERKKRNCGITPMTEQEIAELVRGAKQTVPERVEYYAGLLGVRYGKITLRRQKTRWGSCSSKGNLSFNLALMLAPVEALDSVIVHELCHLKEMNHSARFYSEVKKVFPEYDKWHSWLRENGDGLMIRIGQKR